MTLSEDSYGYVLHIRKKKRALLEYKEDSYDDTISKTQQSCPDCLELLTAAKLILCKC